MFRQDEDVDVLVATFEGAARQLAEVSDDEGESELLRVKAADVQDYMHAASGTPPPRSGE